MCEPKDVRPCSKLGVNWVRKMAQEYGKLFIGGWRATALQYWLQGPGSLQRRVSGSPGGWSADWVCWVTLKSPSVQCH